MTDRELMQQALEALENAEDQLPKPYSTEAGYAITALRDRLAQPEQEPVAWQWLNTGTFRKKLPASAEPGAWNPLYTTPQPRQWVGLTEEEMVDLQDRCGISIHQSDFEAIEAKLREKNK